MHRPHHHSRRRRGHHDVTERRRRPHLWSLADLQPGQVAFRVVCHESAAGGVIGASGSIISRIRDETSCIVSFQQPMDGAEHRVVVVVGSSTPERRLVLEEDCEELVSDAQEALLRVVGRMWQVYGRGRGGGGFCGLLASASQIGVVVGKGGRTITKLKKVSGAHINILPPPPCASPDEQLIQITGSVVSVKRAIVVVTGCLQSCPQLDSHRNQIPMMARRIERSSSSTTSHDQHLQFFPHLSSMLPPSDDSPLSNGDDKISKVANGDEQEVSFRLLVSHSAAGLIIGRAGTVVKSLQNQTGASIRVTPSRTRSWDRVVTVSALENVESRYSPAQTAALLVFGRSIKNDFEKARSSGSIDGTNVSARLLVDLVCMRCLTGSSGMIDADVTEGAAFKVHYLEDNSRDDVILQITGEYTNVTNSLTRVISKLRENVFASNMLEVATSKSFTGRVADATTPTLLQEDLFGAGISQSDSCKSTDEEPGGGKAATTDSSSGNGLSSSSQVSEIERCLRFLLPREGLKLAEAKVPERGGSRETKPPLFHNGFGKSAAAGGANVNRQLGLSGFKCASLPGLQTARGISESEKHSTTLKPGTEHEKKKPASVGNETIEVTISAEAISAVYGEDGSNLDKIRKISGAKVAVVDESGGGKRDEVRIVISGTSDEAKVAQSLIQASILRGGGRC